MLRKDAVIMREYREKEAFSPSCLPPKLHLWFGGVGVPAFGCACVAVRSCVCLSLPRSVPSLTRSLLRSFRKLEPISIIANASMVAAADANRIACFLAEKKAFPAIHPAVRCDRSLTSLGNE